MAIVNLDLARRLEGIETWCASERCGLATIGALPGSTSHRNAERLGFRVAYTKLVLHRDPAW